MQSLDRALDGAQRARIIGHAAGLACYEGLALAGAAGDLAWVAGLQLLAALALLEWAWSACDVPRRRLRRLADAVDGGDELPARQARALLGFLDGLPRRAAWRCLAAWLGAGLLLKAGFGFTWSGLLLAGAYGALPAALVQALGCGALVRVAGEDAEAAVSAGAPRPGPSPRRRFLVALFAPLAMLLAPLAALLAVGLPLTAPVLAVLTLMGGLSALAWGTDLDRGFSPALGALTEGLRRLAGGDFSAPTLPAAGLGGTASALREAASALGGRERAFQAVGPGLDPRQGAAVLGALEAPARERFVAVLAAAWLESDASLGALEPSAGLGALGRFYQSVQDAVQRSGGTVLELGGGRVLAAWGALGGASAQAGILEAALKAAWMLRSSLAVASSQHRLRHAGRLDWSLALASGLASEGAWGPRQQQRFALVGKPLAEVRSLASRPGGPWLDAATAAALLPPYAAVGPAGGLELGAGPE